MPDRTQRETTRAIVRTAAAGSSGMIVGAVAAVLAAPTWLASGAVGTMVTIVGLAVVQLSRERAARFLRELRATYDAKTRGERQAMLRRLLTDPAAQACLADAVRAVLLDARDPCVAPALARLAVDPEHVDSFGRDLVRLLVDLNRVEYEALRKLVGLVAACTDRTSLVLFHDPGSGARPAGIYIRKTDQSAEDVPLGRVPEVPRLFRLLKNNGLGSDAAGGFFDSVTGPQVLVIHVATAARIQRLVRD